MIDIGQADLLISEIANKQRQIDILQNNANKIKQAHIDAVSKKIDDWFLKESEPLKAELESLNALLKPYVEDYLKDNPKKRSVKLPSGCAGFRKGTINFSFTSSPTEKVDAKSELLLKLVKDHKLDNYLVTKESVNWLKLKASLNLTDNGNVISSNGEVLNELSASREPDSFYVKPTKEGNFTTDD